MENHATLRLHQLQLGQHDNFVYLLADPAMGDAVVVNPAGDVPRILTTATDNGYTLSAIWLTHGHRDHTVGVADLVAATGIPVYLSRAMPTAWRPKVPTISEFDDGETLTVGELAFLVIHTPGHSPDGACFLHGNQLIAGDTLFVDGCGRCDLPDSDVEAMYASIHDRLNRLPDDTVIYPGHDYGPLPFATLAAQRTTNRFLRATDKAAFIRARMG